MKNLKYFPFERNRYFYGKLLTVDDFEIEQKYMNDKRRMCNRFLQGSGVVAGMNVVAVDDKTLSIEMGFALDFSGREIVLDAPIIRKLPLLDGFEEINAKEEDISYLYLCVEYAEKEADGVHSVSRMGASEGDTLEYNKYEETYRLFLTDEEPDKSNIRMDLLNSVDTIFWENGVEIKHRIRKFAANSEKIDLTVLIEKKGQQQLIAFDYEVLLTCFTHKGEERCSISFDEREFQKSNKYQLHYTLDVAEVTDVLGKLQVEPKSFSFRLGGKEVTAYGQGVQTIEISNVNVEAQVAQKYYKTAMEEIIKNTYQQSIYLAKIELIKVNDFYLIDEVENIPFQQYVSNGPLIMAMNQIALEQVRNLKADFQVLRNEKIGQNFFEGTSKSFNENVTTGLACINLGIGGKKGQKFYSEEISHGLGLSNVFICLGQEYAQEGKKTVYGEAGIFEDRENEAIVQLAARLDKRKGTFVIGAKLMETTDCQEIRIHWMAVKDMRIEHTEQEKRKLFVEPNMTTVQVRESIYLKAEFKNVPDKRVRWAVKEENGTIDENGRYTAPNIPGVYEVFVQSIPYPELKASAFLVVQESVKRSTKIDDAH